MADNTPTWNEIPYDENADPAQKALEFMLQVQENGGPTLEEQQREMEK